MKSLILLIDDDPIAHIINKRFITLFYPSETVKEFLSASNALEFLKNKKQVENFCCIIFLDIYMPEISGWDFILTLKKKFPFKYKIYLLTSSVNKKDKIKAQAFDEVETLIEKPLSLSKLQKLKFFL